MTDAADYSDYLTFGFQGGAAGGGYSQVGPMPAMAFVHTLG